MGVTFIQSGRFSSAFDPTTISGCVGWWDGSDAASMTFSAGVKISQWADKSGQGRHLAQSTSANQPNWNGSQNSLTTVAFTKASEHYLETASFTLAQPYTLFIAGKYASGQVSPLSSVGGDGLQVYTPSSTHNIYNGSQIGYAQEAADTGAAVAYSYVVNGASSAIYRNGTSKATGNMGAASITTGVRTAERNLNSGYFFGDELYEVIFYNSALGTTDRQTVEAYLKAKWGTP